MHFVSEPCTAAVLWQFIEKLLSQIQGIVDKFQGCSDYLVNKFSFVACHLKRADAKSDISRRYNLIKLVSAQM